MQQVLPQSFIDSLAGLPGFEKDKFTDVHENTEQVTSIRLNPLKPTPATNDLPVANTVPWCGSGRYLSARPSFTLDPVFHGGAYYAQEASSMFVDHIVKEIYRNQAPPKRVLDLCAAPGGKSTLLAAALPGSFIVSNEVIKTRVGMLSENISKWGSDHVIVTNNDPKDFKKLPGYFDLMVVDAPCSGSGLFRKDVAAINEWSEANVEMCSLRQQRILTDTIGSLKEGGFLIYSTCSYSMQEDEEICDWIINQFQLQPVKINIDPSWAIVETISKKNAATGYRFYPDKVQGEGFFIACFRQTNPVDNFYGYHNKVAVAPKQIQSIVKPFLKNFDDYLISDQKEIVIASLKKWEEEIATISNTLNVRKSGVAIGTVKGKDLIPHHELALSHLLSNDIPAVNLAKEDALKYLRRQDLVFENEKKGWTICRFGDINLGWMKVLPNRVNNYYPPNWRILKA
ncbi:methyltransferase RsmF C-terminal domain-like protein [Segetibacter aerophilus]|uniref:rRNA cytosine-C5-methyltransferase n=1 Tax=Segetibacter aerophilus TaxID=670293 RepID=A0A512B9F7_9BACT|nr:RNA methyltransferase [Segetibacter aerophilus]GEO08600.1 rRNA cytosine-C5-methyltransferase [Segetibacter aerophilus]